MATSRPEMEVAAAKQARVVSRSEWLAERKQLLAEEKELTHRRDALAEKRQRLPWVKLEKEYSFDTPRGNKTLAQLFDGKSQLIVYHFMFGPEWEEGCPGCSLMADSFNGNMPHIEARDVTFVAVSRAPLAKIQAFRKRMGWQFKWASSEGNDFNYDFAVSFTKEDIAKGKNYNFGTTNFAMEEAPGMSVFFKDADGGIFHTYSTYGRGLEDMLAVYPYFDRLPKGREESELARPMAWVRHHDKYESEKFVELK